LLDELPAERDAFLVEHAERLLAVEGNAGDVAEELKWAAAGADLPYDAHVIGGALERAEARLRRRREIESELRVGRNVRA
jgi:hypothetical protein